MFETLQRQIEEYADEPWKGAHDEAMLCFDVEGAIRAVVGLFDAVNRIDSQLMLATMQGRLTYDPKVRPQVRRCHRGFLETAEALKREIAELRASGFEIEGEAELDDRRSQARVFLGLDLPPGTDTTALGRADEAMARGETGRPFGAVIDELRSRHRQ